MLLIFILIKVCKIFCCLRIYITPGYWAIDQLVFSIGAIPGLNRSSKNSFKVQGSSYFVHYFGVCILKWYVGINHVPYFIYTGIYPRTKLKIVLLSLSIGKYIDKTLRLNGSHRFLCAKTPILYFLKERPIQAPKYFYSDSYPYSVSINNIRYKIIYKL